MLQIDKLKSGTGSSEGESTRKKRRTIAPSVLEDWGAFGEALGAAERTVAAAEGGFAFAFVEGALVQALRRGCWLLLDEINLAPPEVCHLSPSDPMIIWGLYPLASPWGCAIKPMAIGMHRLWSALPGCWRQRTAALRWQSAETSAFLDGTPTFACWPQ